VSRAEVAALSRAAIDLFAAGWQCRRRTSTGASPAAYGDWTDMQAHETMRRFDQEYDEERGSIVLRETTTIRVSDAVTVLARGDQAKDPDGDVWAVDNIMSSGPGTRKYQLIRSATTVTGRDREAEV
jgi:hypothetical protein